MVAPGITGRTRPTKVKKRENVQKRKRDDVDVEKLEQAVQELVRFRGFLERFTIAFDVYAVFKYKNRYMRAWLTSVRTANMALTKTSPICHYQIQQNKASSPPTSPS